MASEKDWPHPSSAERPATPYSRRHGDPPAAAMRKGHAASGRGLGEILAEIAGRDDPELSLRELVDAMGDRGHGLLIAVLALPNVLPVYLPGLSAIFGLPLVFVALQLVLGRHRLWLPQALLRRSIARPLVARMAAKIAPWLARLERALKPRWPEVIRPIVERVAGVLAVILGLMLSLPIPLTNIPLSIPLVLLGLALAQEDGLMLVIALAMGAIVATIVLTLSGALFLAAFAWLMSLL